MSTSRKTFFRPDLADENTLDLLSDAYWAEYECWRIVHHGMEHFQLLRQTRPKLVSEPSQISDSVTMTIIQCDGARSYQDAETWLNMFRNRAAMRAALKAL